MAIKTFRKTFYSIFLLSSFITLQLSAQQFMISGIVNDKNNTRKTISAEIYDASGELLSKSNKSGFFTFNSTKKKIDLLVFSSQYKVYQEIIKVKDSLFLSILLEPLSINLSEIEINDIYVF